MPVPVADIHHQWVAPVEPEHTRSFPRKPAEQDTQYRQIAEEQRQPKDKQVRKAHGFNTARQKGCEELARYRERIEHQGVVGKEIRSAQRHKVLVGILVARKNIVVHKRDKELPKVVRREKRPEYQLKDQNAPEQAATRRH